MRHTTHTPHTHTNVHTFRYSLVIAYATQILYTPRRPLDGQHFHLLCSPPGIQSGANTHRHTRTHTCMHGHHDWHMQGGHLCVFLMIFWMKRFSGAAGALFIWSRAANVNYVCVCVQNHQVMKVVLSDIGSFISSDIIIPPPFS